MSASSFNRVRLACSSASALLQHARAAVSMMLKLSQLAAATILVKVECKAARAAVKNM